MDDLACPTITYFRMAITNLTACTATSVSLSSVMDTMRSLNLEVKSSNLPFNSSHSYRGCRAWRQRSRTSPTCNTWSRLAHSILLNINRNHLCFMLQLLLLLTLSCSVQPIYLRYRSSKKCAGNFSIQMPISAIVIALISGNVSLNKQKY